jgi:hypothetical protein
MSHQFLNSVLCDAFDRAHDPELGGLRLNSIVAVLLERLEDASVVSEPQVSYFRFERGNISAEVHGWAVDVEDDVLRLFICIDATSEVTLGDDAQPVTLPKDQVDRAFRRIESFVRHALAGKFDAVEESQPVADLLRVLRASASQGQSVELHLITTGVVSDRAAAALSDSEIRREVWDLTRLVRICGSSSDGSITIDFEERFGQTLPCLVTKPDDEGVQVLLTRIPGQMLADIYNDYRSALLERNVRSFLQFNGKVNKGIRDTLKTAPHRFLPYNNGLSTTASSVVLTGVNNGTAQIRSLADFQIVNGGQTTASIAAASRRDKVDLEHVVVPMKLTVVPPERLQGLVPQISKFANTQNRIQEADFFANAPWHIALERLSRNTWTSSTPDAPRGTRWFYERSRGQYSDELAAQGTPAGRRKFRSENPGSQKFTKTDVAKYWLSWEQLPHTVSLGAQKCFGRFMESVIPRRPEPDDAEFKRVVSLAVLFRTAESLYGEMGFTGYRAQVITYTIARLSHHLGKRLPVGEIWKSLTLPDEIMAALRILITGVREVLLKPPTGKNLTEWCKKEDCWEAVLKRQFELSLAAGEDSGASAGSELVASDATTPEQQAVVEAVCTIDAEVWLSISSWAKQTASLLPWQRSLAYSVGRLRGGGRTPSVKQAKQGGILLVEAARVGFRHDSLSSSALATVSAALANLG